VLSTPWSRNLGLRVVSALVALAFGELAGDCVGAEAALDGGGQAGRDTAEQSH
jgi:hypothetical protein